jgi:hypothetical protein
LAAVVVPAAALFMNTLVTSFDDRVLEHAVPLRTDARWFERANAVSRTLVGESFSPAIVGFAAPLSNMADLAEARQHSTTVTATLGTWLFAWALLLGGVLHRYAHGRAIGLKEFLRACARRLLPFAAIALVTLAIYTAATLLYRSVGSDRQLPLLVMLAVVVSFASIVAGYVRARIVIENASLGGAFAATLHMIRTIPATCAAHVALMSVGWALLFAAYAAFDVLVGRGGGPWRAVVAAQVFIISRLAWRLIWEASSLSVVRDARAG